MMFMSSITNYTTCPTPICHLWSNSGTIKKKAFIGSSHSPDTHTKNGGKVHQRWRANCSSHCNQWEGKTGTESTREKKNRQNNEPHRRNNIENCLVLSQTIGSYSSLFSTLAVALQGVLWGLCLGPSALHRATLALLSCWCKTSRAPNLFFACLYASPFPSRISGWLLI